MSNMVVNTNIAAINSHRALKSVSSLQEKSAARLSSGQRINSAADDAAGLAISEKMRSQIRGLDMASKNAQDGISLVQTAEGGMTEVSNMVQRIRELTIQAANDSNESDDRTKIAGEVDQLIQEIDAMSGKVEFNKKKLIDGSFSSDKIHLQVGANAGQKIELNINSMSASSLGINSLSFTGNGSAISAQLSTIDSAIGKVADERAKLGATQNRLEYTIKSLDISSENLTSSESRIRDTDMAKEMMSLTKANVLQQAATTMLSQANQAPQNILQILK